MLLDGTASFAAAHDADRMHDAAVLRERAKVRYLPDPELAALLPARVAVVEVTLRDGTRLRERVEAVRGTVRNPMQRDEVVAKARDLIEPVLGGATASRLIAAILALDVSADIRSLRPLLQAPRD
jgi:2-methylcitrate dehydratase PrpD